MLLTFSFSRTRRRTAYHYIKKNKRGERNPIQHHTLTPWTLVWVSSLHKSFNGHQSYLLPKTHLLPWHQPAMCHVPAFLGLPVSKKITRKNFVRWKAQVLPVIRGRQLVGLLDGSIKAPEPMAIVVAEDKYKTTIVNSMYELGLSRISKW